MNTKGIWYVCEPSQIRNGVFDSSLMMLEQPEGCVYIMFDSNNLDAAYRDSVEELAVQIGIEPAALRAMLGTDGASGGVLVNSDMQAYRSGGSLIDGLYVTGDFASGRFINMAGVKVQVLNDMSWALASGFLAGTSVCQYI